eukprot:scaffold62411_cov59-Phaeocystis_antarctica.AAC.5
MPWLLCASPALRRTACPQPAARRTCRRTVRRTGPAPPQSRDPAAAAPHRPPSSLAPASPPCDTPHAAEKRQDFPGRCFSRSSSISNGSRPQPTQARLTAAGEGAPPSSSAGGTRSSAAGCTPSLAAGWVAAALAASLSLAFSAISASRTSLVHAPRSGCCSRSLASSGLRPSSGSATCSPRTASRRACDIQACYRSRSLGC